MIKNQENNSTFPRRHPAIFRCLAEYRRNVLHADSAVRVLSFGCSSGEEVVDLSAEIPDAKIYGCDIDKPSLEKAALLCGARAKIFESTSENIKANGPFHIVSCMNVLCRHPIGRNEFADLYPFRVFEETLAALDAAIVPGGIIALYNTQYPADACAALKRYEPLKFKKLKNNGWLDKYSIDGVRRLRDGRLFYEGSWLPHCDWIKVARRSPGEDWDPAAVPAQFVGNAAGIDAATVCWKKLELM